MIEHLLRNPEFVEARQQRRPYCWGTVADIVCPEWAAILENLSRSWGITGALKEMKGMGYVDYMGHRMPGVEQMRKEIQALKPDIECTAHNYVSFTQNIILDTETIAKYGSGNYKGQASGA